MALYKEALARRFGARLAIDDFGSGNNGETSLLDYHVDFVKIDMEIVRDIDVAKDHQDIARNLIGYAHDRGIRVIAEGWRPRPSCERCANWAPITCRATSPGGLLLSRAMSTTRSSASSAA